MYGQNNGPPPCFEYVDLGQYSDQELYDYITKLCEFMNNRNSKIKELESNPQVGGITADDIPF